MVINFFEHYLYTLQSTSSNTTSTPHTTTMSLKFVCVDLSGVAKRRFTLSQMAADSKAILQEQRKRTAPTTAAQARKRHKKLKTTASTHEHSSGSATIDQGPSLTSATTIVVDDSDEDEEEPLINRARLRRQQAKLSTPPMSQERLPSDHLQTASQRLPAPLKNLKNHPQDLPTHQPSPTSSVSDMPELSLTQQEFEELDQLDQQIRMEGKQKDVIDPQPPSISIEESWEPQQESQLQHDLLNALRAFVDSLQDMKSAHHQSVWMLERIQIQHVHIQQMQLRLGILEQLQYPNQQALQQLQENVSTLQLTVEQLGLQIGNIQKDITPTFYHTRK
jgi:hypothetical protein